MQRKGVDIVHDGYGSEKDLEMLSCYRENLSGTSFLVTQFNYCSLESSNFKNEFWHQFCSLVAFFLPKSVPKPILTEKKEKKSFDSAPRSWFALFGGYKWKLYVVFSSYFFFFWDCCLLFSVHWKFSDLESQVRLLACVRKEMKMQFFRVNSIFDTLW